MRSIYEGTAPTFHESIKVVESEQTPKKEEPKKEEPKKEEPKKEEPKKEEPKKVSPIQSSVNSGSSTPTTLSDNLKSSGSVDKLLQKATDIDQDNSAEDPSKDTSGWDEEDEKPAPPEEISASTSTTIETPVEQDKPKEDKPEPTSIATDILNKEKEEPKETVKETKSAKKTEAKDAVSEKKQETPVPAATTTTASHGVKSLGLKQSVETLSSLVLKLEQVVESLTAANIEKDERLEALEKKIDSLLQK